MLEIEYSPFITFLLLYYLLLYYYFTCLFERQRNREAETERGGETQRTVREESRREERGEGDILLPQMSSRPRWLQHSGLGLAKYRSQEFQPSNHATWLYLQLPSQACQHGPAWKMEEPELQPAHRWGCKGLAHMPYLSCFLSFVPLFHLPFLYCFSLSLYYISIIRIWNQDVEISTSIILKKK